MNSPHSLLQSLLPEIQRNPQLLGILAQSMGGGGQDVGGILGGQPPQALAGGPPMRQAPQPMPQARPAPMTASAPRMGGPQYGGPRASGWRDMARLVAAGIGEARGGNDLAMLRDEWTKRDQTSVASQRAAEDRARLESAIAGLTPQQQAAAMADPEAFAKAVLNPTVVGESVFGLSGFKTPPMSAAQIAAATKPTPTEGGAYIRNARPDGSIGPAEFQGAPQIVNADPTHNILEITPGARGGAGGPSLGERNNNPGNLEDGEFARSQPGYAGTDGRFARFTTPEAGAAAQESLLAGNYIGRGQNTIQSIIEGVPGEGGRRVHGYSPRQSDGGDNTDEQVNNYIGYVARRVGIDPTAPVPADRVSAVAAAMREFETGQRPGGQGGGTRVVQQGVAKPVGSRPMTDADRQTWGIPPGIPGKIDLATGEPSIISGASSALPKPPPRPVQTAYRENNVSRLKIDRALAGLSARPQSLGTRFIAGEWVNQRTDPDGVDVRANIADIGSLIIHDRSGAAVTVSESPRLKPFVPLITDTPDAAKKKLLRLRQAIDDENGFIEYEYPDVGQPGMGARGEDVANDIGAPAPAAPAAATRGAPRKGKGPVQVRSLQEAQSLPPGTEFVLNGRRGRTTQ